MWGGQERGPPGAGCGFDLLGSNPQSNPSAIPAPAVADASPEQIDLGYIYIYIKYNTYNII